MQRIIAASIAGLTLGLGAHAAVANAASKCSGAYPLHGKTAHARASCGPRVASVQWLLGGHRPSVYTKTAPTFKAKPNGLYGARTKAAVKAMKYRIGYPMAGQCGLPKTETYVTDTASSLLVRLLEGRTPRPTCWVGLAADRIKGGGPSTVVQGATQNALAIKALMLSQLGVGESPFGSNRGPCISYSCSHTSSNVRLGPYQGSTGAYGLAWCASFLDWSVKAVTGHGLGSSNDAYVPTILEHAQATGALQAKPRVGDAVGFLTAQGQLGSAYHVGYVIALVGSSGVETIEGNSDRADGGVVAEVYRPFATYHMVYAEVPGVS